MDLGVSIFNFSYIYACKPTISPVAWANGWGLSLIAASMFLILPTVNRSYALGAGIYQGSCCMGAGIVAELNPYGTLTYCIL